MVLYFVFGPVCTARVLPLLWNYITIPIITINCSIKCKDNSILIQILLTGNNRFFFFLLIHICVQCHIIQFITSSQVCVLDQELWTIPRGSCRNDAGICESICSKLCVFVDVCVCVCVPAWVQRVQILKSCFLHISSWLSSSSYLNESNFPYLHVSFSLSAFICLTHFRFAFFCLVRLSYIALPFWPSVVTALLGWGNSLTWQDSEE